ncbi:tetratricopeptide repeat protein [Hyunsoonleella ulvae]|uniref:tetratricopeptide repeat protein n=1 Tax=Hyunsoonleella ulvae TaxID=2799948 RepID=UPI00193A9ACB|nr:tetratricopeptide repeat protein [Hyunsoonleella ulvae]
MKLFNLIFCTVILCVFSCKTKTETPKLVTNKTDYNQYLQNKNNEILDAAQQDYIFWEKKLEKAPNQFPYLAKVAASQSLLFSETGKIEYLIDAERKLIAANKATNYSNSGYLRALARNHISQHKFKEALKLLEKAEVHGDRLASTQKMLFDVHLELGNLAEAQQYLNKIENYKDFDFLIRLSKWSDHNGDLDKAILYLEKATDMAEANKNKGLMQWSYTNLADYYGHAGRLEDSYSHYLKALALNPNDAYAKKGIAWIAYSHEKNTEEALRILNSITKNYHAPDYHLLKAEIADFTDDINLKEREIALYKKAMGNTLYGNMYNKYNILLLAENKAKTAEALKIAYHEIENRPTAQSYDLLAWTHYNHGNLREALSIMENHVAGHTSEPEVLYHMAEIYKASGKLNKAKDIKEELLKSSFELGPLTTETIKNI